MVPPSFFFHLLRFLHIQKEQVPPPISQLKYKNANLTPNQFKSLNNISKVTCLTFISSFSTDSDSHNKTLYFYYSSSLPLPRSLSPTPSPPPTHPPSLSLSPTKRIYLSITTDKTPLQILTRSSRIFWTVYVSPSPSLRARFQASLKMCPVSRANFLRSLPTPCF